MPAPGGCRQHLSGPAASHDASYVDLIGTGEHESEGVRAVARALMLDEEHQPFEGDPSPAALVGHCFYRLTQAAFRVGVIDGHFKRSDDHDPCLLAGAEFTWLAAFALAATARIHPGARDEWILHAKARLLSGLDTDVSEWAERCDDWDELTPGYWLARVTALFSEAADGVADLECCPARPSAYWWPGAPERGLRRAGRHL